MNILILTKKFPYPLKDGESIAVSNLAYSLKSRGARLTLLSMNTVKHQVDTRNLPESYDCFDEIFDVPLDNRVSVFGAFRNLFSSESYHINRFYFEAYKSKLISLLDTHHFDVIQLETLYLVPYIDLIKKQTKAPIVMRSHNVEFEIWERIVSNTKQWPKSAYLRYLTQKLKRFEIQSLAKVDHLITVTQRDFERYKKLGYSGNGFALPIGVASQEYEPKPIIDSNQKSLSFIGSLDWMPNLEGLEWFIDHVFPIILKSIPNCKLHIAGRNTPSHIRSLANENIIIEGEVDSAVDFLNQHPITIVPLLSGSGMRVKILEGMALGRVVVSTSIGAEGIHAKNKTEIFIEDESYDFAKVIVELLSGIHDLKDMSLKAMNFIRQNFDREVNAQKLIDYYDSIIEEN